MLRQFKATFNGILLSKSWNFSLWLFSFNISLQQDGPDIHLNKELQAKDAEIKKLTDVIRHFKKLLAETEMKLSDAYQEISDLRKLQTENIIHRKVQEQSLR